MELRNFAHSEHRVNHARRYVQQGIREAYRSNGTVYTLEQAHSRLKKYKRNVFVIAERCDHGDEFSLSSQLGHVESDRTAEIAISIDNQTQYAFGPSHCKQQFGSVNITRIRF